jgi:hypothetical protein
MTIEADIRRQRVTPTRSKEAIPQGGDLSVAAKSKNAKECNTGVTVGFDEKLWAADRMLPSVLSRAFNGEL